MSLNGGYAMIKYNSTQEELQIAYRSKKPVLFYDENQRAHWAVIEETATESVDEETQEPITLYEYSYRLIDEASSVVANPTLSGNEATLDGLEVDGTKYKVGGSEKLYLHRIQIQCTPYCYCDIYTRNNIPFTRSLLIEYIASNGNIYPNCIPNSLNNTLTYVRNLSLSNSSPTRLYATLTIITFADGTYTSSTDSSNINSVPITDKVTEV